MNPETWFRPAVFELTANIASNQPAYDTRHLGYRFRGWFSTHYGKIDPPTELPPRNYTIALIMDVWDLPVGMWNLVVIPTDSVPKDFCGRIRGSTFEYREALDVRDTINAFEACYWRLYRDNNLYDAEKWLTRMLEINPNSIPAWALYAGCYEEVKADSAIVVNAYDQALKHMDDYDDRALPDTTRGLHPSQKDWWTQLRTDIIADRCYYIHKPLYGRE